MAPLLARSSSSPPWPTVFAAATTAASRSSYLSVEETSGKGGYIARSRFGIGQLALAVLASSCSKGWAGRCTSEGAIVAGLAATPGPPPSGFTWRAPWSDHRDPGTVGRPACSLSHVGRPPPVGSSRSAGATGSLLGTPVAASWSGLPSSSSCPKRGPSCSPASGRRPSRLLLRETSEGGSAPDPGRSPLSASC